VGECDVDVLRASERTTALNAEVAGLGATRRVVLWDTVLGGRVPPREIRFLVAHELGHDQQKHLLKGVAWFALTAPLLTWLVAVSTRRRGGIAEPAAVPLAVLVLLAAEIVLLPAANAISRRYEAEADWRALELTRDPVADRALMRLFVADDLTDPAPPRWSRVLLGTHPTLEQRAAMAQAWAARNGHS
jgi:STE24 endopeptidase